MRTCIVLPEPMRIQSSLVALFAFDFFCRRSKVPRIQTPSSLMYDQVLGESASLPPKPPLQHRSCRRLFAQLVMLFLSHYTTTYSYMHVMCFCCSSSRFVCARGDVVTSHVREPDVTDVFVSGGL